MVEGTQGGAGRQRVGARRLEGGRWLLALLVAVAVTVGTGGAGAQDGGAELRFVQGASGVGGLDLYVDGAAAIFGADFASVSDVLTLEAGEHQLSLVPTGASPQAALVEGAVEMAAESSFLAVTLGTADDLRLLLYPVDLAPLAEGMARLRVVHGAPDLGPIDVAITGGDVIFPTLDYPDGTEYADVEAAVYDLGLRVAGTDLVALDLPQTELPSDRIVDLIAVGQVADGSLQTVAVESSPLATQTEAGGGTVSFWTGDCDDPGEPVAEIEGAVPPLGEAVGAGEALEVTSAVGSLPVAFDEIAGGALIVSAAEGDGSPLACGTIGGQLTDQGGLVVGLRGGDGAEAAGVALLAPGAADPTTTDVAVYLVERGTSPAAVVVGPGRDAAPSRSTPAATPAADAED